MKPSSDSHQAGILRKNDHEYVQSLSRFLRVRGAQGSDLTREIIPAEKNVLMAREVGKNATPDSVSHSHWRFERVFDVGQIGAWIMPALEEGISQPACTALREHIVSVGFGENNPLRLWMLSEKEEVAAACLAYCGSESWNVYHVRTRVRFRGRGAAAYLLQSVCAAAAANEIKLMGLSSPGYLIPFHERNGFKVISIGSHLSTPLTSGHTELPS